MGQYECKTCDFATNYDRYEHRYYCTKHSDWHDQHDCCGYHSENGVESGAGCYLTTAMCEILGKNDDCFELEFLRQFRERYLTKTAKGRALLSEYKAISIPIVSTLRKSPHKYEIAQIMYNSYITPVIELIKEEKNEQAVHIYKKMVYFLQSAN